MKAIEIIGINASSLGEKSSTLRLTNAMLARENEVKPENKL